ncbi:MAG: hypothetical protein IT289_01180 [Oligoflexia bacterium]|nr:hypothetical protein [Oligoflexia bacterium]
MLNSALLIIFSHAIAFGGLPEKAELRTLLANPDVLEEVRKAQNFPAKRIKSCEAVVHRYDQDELKLAGIARWVHNSGLFHDFDRFEQIPRESTVYRLPLVDAHEAYVKKRNQTYSYDPDQHEVFISPDGKQFVLELASRVKDEISKHPLYLTAATSNPQRYTLDHHCLHRSGYSIDIRPLPGLRPTHLWSEEYDREMNRRLILELVNDLRVRRIYFSDPKLLKDPEVKAAVDYRAQTQRPVEYIPMRDHYNHIHIELYWAENLKALSKAILEVFRETKNVAGASRQPVGKRTVDNKRGRGPSSVS